MKYRRLTPEELREVEAQFINFLAANTITGPDWEQIKRESPEKADHLIGLFSDIVFDQVLGEVEYLEYKTPKDYKTFRFFDDRIVLLGLRIEGESNLDFTSDVSPQQIAGQLQLSGARLKMYQAEKTYSTDKKTEIFQMMENGALISRDGSMYKTLEQLRDSGVK